MRATALLCWNSCIGVWVCVCSNSCSLMRIRQHYLLSQHRLFIYSPSASGIVRTNAQSTKDDTTKDQGDIFIVPTDALSMFVPLPRYNLQAVVCTLSPLFCLQVKPGIFQQRLRCQTGGDRWSWFWRPFGKVSSILDAGSLTFTSKAVVSWQLNEKLNGWTSVRTSSSELQVPCRPAVQSGESGSFFDITPRNLPFSLSSTVTWMLVSGLCSFGFGSEFMEMSQQVILCRSKLLCLYIQRKMGCKLRGRVRWRSRGSAGTFLCSRVEWINGFCFLADFLWGNLHFRGEWL